MGKLNKGKSSPMFGTWWKKIEPLFDNGTMDGIYDFLKSEGKRGVKIAPLSSDVYNVFQKVEINNVNVIILGQDPYFKFENGVPIANGIMFDCANTMKLQPSLEILYNGIEKDVYDGLALERIKNPDLTFMCNEGILLLNSALTVEEKKPESHSEIWKPFIQYLFENVFRYMDVPIFYLGKNAQYFQQFSFNKSLDFLLSHPASTAYNKNVWETNDVFKKVTDIVYKNNGIRLQWLEKLPF